MTSCVFRYCKNTSRNVRASSGISFHRFVHPEHPNRKQWIKVVRKDRGENTWLPSKASHVCSSHFQPDDIYRTETGRNFLKKTAIPSSNPTQPVSESRQDSPTSLEEVQISDSDSIIDPYEIDKLKIVIRTLNSEKNELRGKLCKIQNQNKYLRKKTKRLTATVKELKEKLNQNTVRRRYRTSY